MIAFFLFLLIVAIALGIVGVVVKGLLYLLIIGIVVFLVALLLGALRIRRAGRRPTRLLMHPPGLCPGGLAIMRRVRPEGRPALGNVRVAA